MGSGKIIKIRKAGDEMTKFEIPFPFFLSNLHDIWQISTYIIYELVSS